MTKKNTLSTTHFAPFLKAKEELDKKIKAEGEIAIKAFFKDYFDQNPNVYGVMWHQFTPYFNDGDECVFGLRGVYVFPTKKDFDGDESAFYDFDCYGEEPTITLEAIEDILMAVFGDHAQVKVTRESIESEEYEHE